MTIEINAGLVVIDEFKTLLKALLLLLLLLLILLTLIFPELVLFLDVDFNNDEDLV